MIIRNRRKFALGAVGLVTFFVVLTVWMSPIMGEQSGLAWADDFFNQLSKSSAYQLPALLQKAPGYRGKTFDVTFKARKPEDAARIARVFTVALGGGQAPEASAAAGPAAQPPGSEGPLAEAAGDRVHLRGDLGTAAVALLTDAEPLYHNQDGELQQKYGMSGQEVLYWYWTAFGEIYKHYIGRGEVATSNFASEMRTKVCEPVYNFAGIAPTRASEAAGKLAFLLAFYVVYTIWYGFSIMFLFEGMAISAHRVTKKEV